MIIIIIIIIITTTITIIININIIITIINILFFGKYVRVILPIGMKAPTTNTHNTTHNIHHTKNQLTDTRASQQAHTIAVIRLSNHIYSFSLHLLQILDLILIY